jgi:uncharacterized protein YoxC
MVIEICVAVIAVAFVALVVFLIMTLCNLIKTLKNVNELTTDIKKKSESLNFLFRPLFKMNKERKEENKNDNYEKASIMMNYMAEGILLFKKLKGD